MFKQGLVAAMEEVQNELPVDSEEVIDEAVAVADESAEIQKENQAAEVTAAQIEDAVQAGEELEEIQEVAEESVESGEGLNEEAAEMASIAIESIRNRLGFHKTTRVVPATESFGNTNTRLVSTKLVVEGIKDTLKTIWESIRAAAMRVWDFLKALFNKFTKSLDRFEKMFQNLSDRADAIPSGAKPKEDKLKGSYAKAYSKAGNSTYAAFKEVNSNIVKLRAAVPSINHAVLGVSQVLSGTMSANDSQKFTVDVNKAYEEIVKAVNNNGLPVDAQGVAAYKTKADQKAGKGKNKITGYGPFLGERILALEEKTQEVGGVNYTQVSFSLTDSGKDPGKEIKALTVSEVREASGLMVEAVRSIRKSEEAFKDAEKVCSQAADLAKNITSSLGKAAERNEQEDGRKIFAIAKRDVGNLVSNIQSINSSSASMTFSHLAAAANLISASIRNLKEKKD